jgi:hypothetical protein
LEEAVDLSSDRLPMNEVADGRSHWPSGHKAWVCGRLLAGIADSNLSRRMDVCGDFCVL